jgi:hypothetical protein
LDAVVVGLVVYRLRNSDVVGCESSETEEVQLPCHKKHDKNEA